MKILLLLLLTLPLMGQNTRYSDTTNRVYGSYLQPISGAIVRVCASNATGTPCNPTAAIYGSIDGTASQANPFTSDAEGNYSFYVAPGRYLIQITDPKTSSTFGKPDVVVPPDPTGTATLAYSVAQNVGIFTTTGASTDTYAVPGMTSNGVCQLPIPTNTTATSMTGLTVTTNAGSITLSHPATAGGSFAFFCTLQ